MTTTTSSTAAIYARKSTEQNVADTERSVARQVEHARAYAARKGWRVAEEHVYIDDGISGAVFGDKRPGLARLLNALSPHPPFRVLIMSEESRLGREQIETGYTLKLITDAGVRVFFYLEDRERTLDSAMDKVMLSLTSFASEMEREKARQRTHDTLIRKARAGHVANGATFGYRNVRPAPGGPVTREIVPAEAAVIRRVFDLVGAGVGFKKAAIILNHEGVRGPVPRRRGKPGGWAPSTIRSLILRDAYRGVSTWNKAQRLMRGGTRKKIDRPASEWVAVPTPHTRIVSDAAWQAAHDRLAASRAVYLAATRGQTFGRPVNGTPARYLLTGFAECGGCGSSMFVGRARYAPHGRRAVFGCVGYHQRGRAICQNNLTALLDDATEGVLTAIESDLLRPEVLETGMFRALEMYRLAPAELAARGRACRDELARLEREAARLAAAIAAGGEIAALVGALQERERQRIQLRADLAALEQMARPRGEIDARRLVGKLGASLRNWRATLRQDVPHAREALRALLAGRLVFTPQERDGARFYAFEGPGTVRKIIAGLALPNDVMTS